MPETNLSATLGLLKGGGTALLGPGFQTLNLTHRGRFYFAFWVGLLYWQVLGRDQTAMPAVLGLCFFLGALIWLGFRHTHSGSEIRGAYWRYFVGPDERRVFLGDIDALRVLGRDDNPARMELALRDGSVEDLPPELAANLPGLRRELARRGIPVLRWPRRGR